MESFSVYVQSPILPVSKESASDSLSCYVLYYSTHCDNIQNDHDTLNIGGVYSKDILLWRKMAVFQAFLSQSQSVVLFYQCVEE